MQLSKLEIKGFKSFGDKVTVHFDDGITGIVGPNGCGKSNIVDSIRWVLGEQKTKALRSEKMENVIFNGTKNRKPLQMAEVSLSFNNTKNLLPTEYSQVTITRRYYRSGESEYLLNGVQCRLKDVTNLFLDTGIGSDSYAIIELKMVDEILNDKDNSRRNLFEEAAGISKFKKRKKETLKKLQDTDKDLERVEDLLFEIEKNLKSLEKQAKQAEKYLQVKEEYKELSVAAARKGISAQKDLYESLKKQIDEETASKEHINAEFKKLEADLEKDKTELVRKENLLSSRQATLNDQVSKIRKYEGEKKIRGERLKYLRDKTESLARRIKEDKDNNEVIYVGLKSLNEEKESFEKLLAEQTQKIELLQQEYEKQKTETKAFQEEISVISNTYKTKQEEVYQLKKSLEINEVQLTSLKKEFEKMNSDNVEYAESIDLNQEMLEGLAKRLDEQNQELDELKKGDELNTQYIEQNLSSLDDLKDQLTKINRSRDAAENEYNLTKSLVDNLEGFPEAIKFLKKNAEWGQDVPLLSDLVSCDESYRVVIENFVEAYMSYYVVDTVEQSYRAVNLLSESSKGKANFFVLDHFKDYKAQELKDIEGCIPVKSIIEYDKKYQKLIDYIFDDVYMVQGSDNIPEKRTEVFVTASGKVTKRKYSVSGGSVGLFEGKRIGRAKNLEKLEAKIKSFATDRDKVIVKIDRKNNEINELKNKKFKEKIEEVRKEINTTNEEYIGIKLKQEQLSSVLSNNSNKKEDILKNVKILEDGIQSNKPQLELQLVELDSLNDKILQMQDELENQNEVLNQKSNIYNQENIQFHQLKNKIESLSQEESYKKSSLENNEKRIERNTHDLQTTESEIKQMAENSSDNDEELVSLYEEKESIEKGVNEAEKDYYGTRGNIDEREKSIKETQRRKENSDGLLMELQNKMNEAKLSLTSVKERLKVEFNVNLDQVMIDDGEHKESLLELSAEQLNDRVESCRTKISNMGPINPMAVEAYEEIKQRYDFITEQRKDLAESKKILIDTISEIDTVAKENFLKTFEDVKVNFVRVFKSLFTEDDQCDLSLANPDMPLESSIDIIAKPKGKRPLTINQLSGGEKTLTAVALLFSIYLIKPAPFCIFDEVDAPLDDANIDKFNNIIREFSSESQFILVTHNKRTMATTDVMYGVTMQESGVSRLVPVDLRSVS